MNKLDQDRRFSLRDLFAIVTGCALSAWITKHLWEAGRLRSLTPINYFPWPYGVSVAELVAAVAILGLILAGPFVLIFRWLAWREFRRPTLGEVIWLVPLATFGATWMASQLQLRLIDTGQAPVPVLIGALVQVYATFFSIVLLGNTVMNRKTKSTWSEIMGCMSCAGASVLILRVFTFEG
jgi:hypothetical protein